MHLDAGHTPRGEVTRLLGAARDGDATAIDRIIQLVYDDLCAIAGRQLRREPSPRTMHPASLVHEAYMKLANGAVVHAGDRAHFFALAARAMRQVLVEHARRRSAAKRGPMQERVALGDHAWVTSVSPEEILTLNDAIDELEPRQRQVVECRFFGGLEEREIAATLGVDERTVRRDWVKARAWLYRALYGAASA
jgi:RNA polymerase sigma-70 factor (ECF subfamily)